ncbi:hypothetical protein D3C77_301090 [compost metagenome]
MIINPRSQTGTNLLQTRLAKPYHYRRSGRYYLRLRPQGTTTGFFTLSLRTTDKATAMTISQEILQTLKAFHFDNPEATWEELRERLIDIAESCLTMAHGDGSLVAYEMIHDEQHVALREASAKLPLSVNQQRAISKALEILEAAQERLEGRPGKLVEIVRDLKGENCGTPVTLSPSLSVLPSEGLTFKALSALYIEERKDHVEANTMRDVKSSCKVIAEILGDLDLKSHTREDMKNLREKLLEDRKPSTVKKLLTRLSTVMDWAVNNDYISKSLDKGLKPTKGADSAREAFSQDQVKALMAHAKTLPVDAWQRWALSLGRFSELLNGMIRDVLGVKADRTQTFHSLRHSLAGTLKAAEIPVGTAESILGHASGSISYDLYGAGSAVEVERMAEALTTAFGLA